MAPFHFFPINVLFFNRVFPRVRDDQILGLFLDFCAVTLKIS
jgi:hypothetical protein